ncbi:MAG: 50S rRNA methyltransferase [Euryarchaeota archaeon]|nr:50S rRNA methyltransferase [Euryarchaeota archaeon]|tara:strand:+ start:812 stop:1243 length:432 start_codon:yes stop_codon:yes gene_type:complete
MARVVVHLHGRPKDGGARLMIENYAKRVSSRGISVEFHSGKKSTNEYEQRINSIVGDIIILDERGKQTSSLDFARTIQDSSMSERTLNLVIGPADGFSLEMKERHPSISLSMMTFPHEVAAAMLMEQIYRACEINRGSPYHRE